MLLCMAAASRANQERECAAAQRYGRTEHRGDPVPTPLLAHLVDEHLILQLIASDEAVSCRQCAQVFVSASSIAGPAISQACRPTPGGFPRMFSPLVLLNHLTVPVFRSVGCAGRRATGVGSAARCERPAKDAPRPSLPLFRQSDLHNATCGSWGSPMGTSAASGGARRCSPCWWRPGVLSSHALAQWGGAGCTGDARRSQGCEERQLIGWVLIRLVLSCCARSLCIQALRSFHIPRGDRLELSVHCESKSQAVVQLTPVVLLQIELASPAGQLGGPSQAPITAAGTCKPPLRVPVHPPSAVNAAPAVPPARSRRPWADSQTLAGKTHPIHSAKDAHSADVAHPGPSWQRCPAAACWCQHLRVGSYSANHHPCCPWTAKTDPFARSQNHEDINDSVIVPRQTGRSKGVGVRQ